MACCIGHAWALAQLFTTHVPYIYIASMVNEREWGITNSIMVIRAYPKHSIKNTTPLKP